MVTDGGLAGLLDEVGEDGLGLLEQVGGRVELGDAAGLEDEDAVVVDDGVEAVGNGEDLRSARSRLCFAEQDGGAR